jgi:ankyrin repeat protein
MDERELINRYLDERDEFRDRIINDGGFGLHYAAETGDINLAKIKIDLEKVDINYRDDEGFTPLIKAVLKKHKDFVSFILGRGADPDLQTNDGFTALMGAVEMGFDKITDVLLKHGADTNLRNIQGATVLHIAASRGDVAVIKKLLKSGADKTIRDNTDLKKLLEWQTGREVITISGDEKMLDGLTPADIARMCKQKEAEEILSKE